MTNVANDVVYRVRVLNGTRDWRYFSQSAQYLDVQKLVCAGCHEENAGSVGGFQPLEGIYIIHLNLYAFEISMCRTGRDLIIIRKNDRGVWEANESATIVLPDRIEIFVETEPTRRRSQQEAACCKRVIGNIITLTSRAAILEPREQGHIFYANRYTSRAPALRMTHVIEEWERQDTRLKKSLLIITPLGQTNFLLNLLILKFISDLVQLVIKLLSDSFYKAVYSTDRWQQPPD